MEEILFWIMHCPECNKTSMLETYKDHLLGVNDEEAWEETLPMVQCPLCAGWFMPRDGELTAMCGSDIERIDDEVLFSIWRQVSGFIIDQASDDSLLDSQRSEFGLLAEKVVDVLAAAPVTTKDQPIYAYTFAVLFQHKEWMEMLPIMAMSEELARAKAMESLEGSAEVISGLHLLHVSEVD